MSPRQPQSSPLVATHGQLADVLGLNDEPASREMVFWQQSLADYVEKIAAIEKPSTPAVRRKFYDADGKLKPAAAERLADLQGKRNRLLAGIKQMDAQRQSRKLQTSKADVVIAFGPSDLLNFLHHSEGELLAHIYDLRNAKPAQMEIGRAHV